MSDTTFYLVVDDDIEPIPIVVIGDTSDEDKHVLEVLRLVKIERAKTRDN